MVVFSMFGWPVAALFLMVSSTGMPAMSLFWRSDSRHMEPDTPVPSKLSNSKVLSLRRTANKFTKCLNRDDIDVPQFIAAATQFMDEVRTFGDFTQRGVEDAQQNLKRVDRALGGRIASMRAFLLNEVRRGSRLPTGGPAGRTAAEALLWARLGLSMWVETFKVQLRKRSSLRDATREGFQRSLARYLDRFGRAAFSLAARKTPEWDEIRARTHLGCRDGVCSDDALSSELRTFVQDVEPVLQKMQQLQKSAGLEDPRTP